MPRYKLTIEYDGRFFCGWQRQKHPISVQQALEEAVTSFCGQQEVLVYGSGRTDTGVHALGQVAHVDLIKEFLPYRVMDALNFYLKKYSIAILAVEKVSAHFHARFSAKSRTYIYRIHNRRAPVVLDKGRVWHIINPLNTDKMQEAAQLFRGMHDFNSFRTVRCQAPSSLRKIDFFEVSRQGDLIQLEVQSRSFLHNQVRIMIGSLVLIGEGKWSKRELEEALQRADRRTAGPTAPPEGLYFARVDY